MALPPEKLAFLAGLLVGEGSFTMQGPTPVCTLKMHVRHEHLLRLVRSWMPFTDFYGPYVHQGRHYFVIRWRGPVLMDLIQQLERFDLASYCPHVNGRMQRIIEELKALE